MFVQTSFQNSFSWKHTREKLNFFNIFSGFGWVTLVISSIHKHINKRCISPQNGLFEIKIPPIFDVLNSISKLSISVPTEAARGFENCHRPIISRPEQVISKKIKKPVMSTIAKTQWIAVY